MSDEDDNKPRIYAGGLPYELTEGDIICVFSQYGEVTEISLSRDKDTGKSRGFCFLKYEDPRSCELAVDNFNGTTIVGRKIKVSLASNPAGNAKGRKAINVAPTEDGPALPPEMLEVKKEKPERLLPIEFSRDKRDDHDAKPEPISRRRSPRIEESPPRNDNRRRGREYDSPRDRGHRVRSSSRDRRDMYHNRPRSRSRSRSRSRERDGHRSSRHDRSPARRSHHYSSSRRHRRHSSSDSSADYNNSNSDNRDKHRDRHSSSSRSHKRSSEHRHHKSDRRERSRERSGHHKSSSSSRHHKR